MLLAWYGSLFEVKDLKEKYKNLEEQYYISRNSIEFEVKVAPNLTETWKFDGSTWMKTIRDTAGNVKVAGQQYQLHEFLGYIDELIRMKNSVLELQPIKISKRNS